MVPVLAALADQNDAEFFGRLSKAERDTLEQLLQRHGQAGADDGDAGRLSPIAPLMERPMDEH